MVEDIGNIIRKNMQKPKRKNSLNNLMKRMEKQGEQLQGVTFSPTENPKIVALHLQMLGIAARVKKEGLSG